MAEVDGRKFKPFVYALLRVKTDVPWIPVDDETTTPSFLSMWARAKNVPLPDVTHDKSERESEKHRVLGNEACQNQRYSEALGHYNRCVQLAPKFGAWGKKCLAFAFANRSVALLHLQRYADAMTDIGRAESAGYPDDLVYRLQTRRGLCLVRSGRLQDGLDCYQKVTDKITAQLSSGYLKDPNAVAAMRTSREETLAEMRKIRERLSRQQACVETPINETKGVNFPESWYQSPPGEDYNYYPLHSRVSVSPRPNQSLFMYYSPWLVKAEEEFEPGTLLCTEKPGASVLLPSKFFSHCLNCLMPAPVAVPCDQCSLVCFCSEKCRDEGWKQFHGIECLVLENFVDPDLKPNAYLVFRIMLKHSVTTWREILLSLTVEDAGKYENKILFFLDEEKYFQKLEDRSMSLMTAAYVVKCLSAIRSFDETIQEDLEFLGRMVCCLLISVRCDARAITECSRKVNCIEEVKIGLALYPTVSLLKHSCDPNVKCFFKGDKVFVKSVKKLSKGDELSSNYGFKYTSVPKDERQLLMLEKMRGLWDKFRMRDMCCTCKACLSDWPLSFELSLLPDRVKCSRCPYMTSLCYAPDPVTNVCQWCKTDVSAMVQLWKRSQEKFLECAKRVEVGKVSKEDVDFLEKYASLLGSLLYSPSAQVSYAQDILELSYALSGNTNFTEISE
ncbi:unnamed protein product [Notodromas monacha]|uniref:SET and MYND domain-containing protein 4 n=1 Tax=Notodromas monacha TaxID=399045 RepID=A0A7R9BP02_9CRUS|nr:unnamed protein product [Notodromas monacha]CAG0917657.1 unnamed protein product [Notodromas monacha]